MCRIEYKSKKKKDLYLARTNLSLMTCCFFLKSTLAVISAAINSTVVLTLNTFAFQMNRYMSMFIILFGSIGNILNLFIFHRPNHRTNPCAVYFFYASIAGLIALYSGLISRIFAGFSLDESATTEGLCQTRAFIVWVSTTASSWFLTYATVDRYGISR
jgi:hypothetical protein